MQIILIETFLDLMETRNFNRTAERLNITQSTVTHRINALEAMFARKLFARNKGGTQPTAAGLRLYTHARAILRAIDDARADLLESQRAVTGEVAVGLAYSAVKAIGMPLARRVLQDYPGLRLSLTESLSGTTLLHLQSVDVDMALVYNPPATPILDRTPLLEERMVLIGRPDIIGTSPDPITADEVLDLPIILLRQGVSARALMEDTGLLKKLEARARLQMNSVQAIGDALVAGLGCAIGTDLFMHERLQSGELISRPIIAPVLHRTLYLCQLTTRPPTVAREVIHDLIVQLTLEAVASGAWPARVLYEPPR